MRFPWSPESRIERFKKKCDFEGLVRLMRHDKPEVREAAATAIAELGVPAFAGLRQLLKHKDNVVRETAAAALSGMGMRGIDELIDILEEQPNYADDEVAAILRLGADKSIRDKAGHTPRQEAVAGGYMQVANML